MAAEIVFRVGIDGLIMKARSLANEDFSRISKKKEDFSGLGLGTHLKDLQLLVQNLEKVQALLPDDENKVESSIVRAWLKEMVTVASDADDLLGEFAYDVWRLKVEIRDKKRNKVRNFFSYSNPFLLRSKITRRIRSINSRLGEIIELSAMLNLQLEKRMDMSAELEETMQNKFAINESQFFTDIRKLLFSSEQNDEDFCIITIVGEGGLGKTTLAREAYRGLNMLNHFDEKMWVCVSNDFDINRILKLMLQSITRNTGELSSRDVIEYNLLESLKGKKYLLVLDDVGNVDFSNWSSLKDCLLKLGGSRGSKILVTTRYREVAEMMELDKCYMRCLRYQSMDECWSMFRNIAFAGGGAVWTSTSEEIGKRIVGRCQGHPLLIKLVASLMYSKKDEREWLMIDDAISNLQLADHLKAFTDIVKFCYDHLPSSTFKQCFIYCSIFPKDSNMEREELIQLWMAQGLFSPPRGSQLTMESTGTKYLYGLMKKHFLQGFNEDEDEDGTKTLCKMDNRLHDVALSLSKGYCSIIESREVKDDIEATHLSLIRCKVEMSKVLRNKFAKLRTLRLEDTGNLEEMLKYSRCLRVLIVVDSLLEELPSSIGKLKHLTYLDISKTRIVRLPNSITSLYNLQTLRLYDLKRLPRNFENLISLRHFHVENFKDLDKLNLLPPKFQELINPSSFKASFKACLGRECPIDKLEQLEQPDRYSSLKIYRLENVNDGKKAGKANLSRMSKIDSLKFHWNARRENSYDENVLEGLVPHPNVRNLTIENFKGSKFPSWTVRTGQLCNLVKIELEDCSCCEQVPPLGHLPYLKIVRILGMDSVKCIGNEFYGLTDLDEETSSHSRSSTGIAVFPALREFCLKRMASLEQWSEASHKSHSSPKAFPCLEKLEVEQCPKLSSLPADTLSSGCKNLGRLQISLCDELTHLPEVLGRLQFLADLEIRGLPSVPEVLIGHPDVLKSLTIGGCFSSSKDNYHTQHASASRSALHLKGGCANSLALPEQVQNLSNLRHLTIWGYGELEDLPEWLGKLRYLQILKLELCGKLKHLPKTLRQLTDLVELNVCLCPLLEERCIRGSRPEWNKISHIPTIKMSYETIQSPN